MLSALLWIARRIYRLFAKKTEESNKVEPFIVSAYLERIEKAWLNILEQKKPTDWTVILWWGLDGLRMNEDGSLEWISRKKPKPVSQSIFYQPCQNIASLPQFNMCQSTQATIDALQEQIAMQNINIRIQAQLQSHQARYFGYCSPYVYDGIYGGAGGTGSTCLQQAYR